METISTSYEVIESVFKFIVQYAVLLLEFVGVCVIVSTAVKCIIGVLQKKKENLRLKLAEGISFALEFKLGSEVLHTLLARSMDELAIIGAVIVLRALLTLIIHWEIKNEEKRPELSFIDKEEDKEETPPPKKFSNPLKKA